MAYEFIKDSYQETLQRLSITQTAYQFNPQILIACGQESEEYTRSYWQNQVMHYWRLVGLKQVFRLERYQKQRWPLVLEVQKILMYK